MHSQFIYYWAESNKRDVQKNDGLKQEKCMIPFQVNDFMLKHVHNFTFKVSFYFAKKEITNENVINQYIH